MVLQPSSMPNGSRRTSIRSSHLIMVSTQTSCLLLNGSGKGMLKSLSPSRAELTYGHACAHARVPTLRQICRLLVGCCFRICRCGSLSSPSSRGRPSLTASLNASSNIATRGAHFERLSNTVVHVAFSRLRSTSPHFSLRPRHQNSSCPESGSPRKERRVWTRYACSTIASIYLQGNEVAAEQITVRTDTGALSTADSSPFNSSPPAF